MLKLCEIEICPNGTIGINLSRSPWEPYPWVSDVQNNSKCYEAGIRIGDSILEFNNTDLIGWKISELADKIHKYWSSGGKIVNFLIWKNNENENQQINQHSLQKFASCLQNIAQLLECPICLEIVKPPSWQCCNGHILCSSCRCRTLRCPVCRVPLGPRGRSLISDKLYTIFAENFPCQGTSENTSKHYSSEKIRNKQQTSIVAQDQLVETTRQNQNKTMKTSFCIFSPKTQEKPILNNKV